ncbi:MAG: AAA family ATPase, partial [Treponema sp.]|nr:AAA family ATPase [Treponema sp.]
LDEIMCASDFPASYRTDILNRVKKEFSLDSLEEFDKVQDKVLEWIGESISIYHDEKFQRRPRIMVLVGPTGVGKTTTIAKLAANFGIDSNRKIVFITIDTFRIGAKQQLEAYGNILQYPCYAVDEFNELKKTIAVHSDDTDIILIDTFGKSPRDMEKLGQMKKLLDACGPCEVFLTVSAATKSSDLEEILQQFEPFNYKSVIITKMDETSRIGNIIGVLAEKRKSISYITDGQKVPADIKKASVIDFLINLEGFKVNRIKLEERFPQSQTEQFKKWS